MAVVPELDPFSPANGFAEPPASSTYSEDFLARYRAAQHDRVARIDAIGRRDVLEVAAELVRSPRTLSAVGPFDGRDFESHLPAMAAR